ncbi:MAG: hypothetical protein IH609_19600 [Dehalococcoidia bacterium]|nr:hypothetical protein [Dehalococcoidia bacterium]
MRPQDWGGRLVPYQFVDRMTHMEIRLEGVLDDGLVIEDAVVTRVGDVRRVLVDYSGVTEVRLDSMSLATTARLQEAAGVKVAVYAPRPAMFGLNRQVLQLAGVREGVTASVFSDLGEARTWLLAG